MSRDEAYLNAMLRELGAAYYQTLHGEGTASDVARAVDAVADAEGGRDLATEPGRSGASGDAGHHLGEETVTTQASGESERRIVVGVDGSVPSKAALAWALKQARLTGATVEAVIAWSSRHLRLPRTRSRTLRHRLRRTGRRGARRRHRRGLRPG